MKIDLMVGCTSTDRQGREIIFPSLPEKLPMLMLLVMLVQEHEGLGLGS